MQQQQKEEADKTAVRVALWRAMHVQIDPLPHVLEDEIQVAIDEVIGALNQREFDGEKKSNSSLYMNLHNWVFLRRCLRRATPTRRLMEDG